MVWRPTVTAITTAGPAGLAPTQVSLALAKPPSYCSPAPRASVSLVTEVVQPQLREELWQGLQSLGGTLGGA